MGGVHLYKKSGRFDEKDMEIARLYTEGVRQPEIARRMGLTKQQLCWRLTRLALSGRIKRRFPRGHGRRLTVDAKKTKEAILRVAQEEFERQEEQYINSAFELILWALHKEYGFGARRLKRAFLRMYRDYDENCRRYGLNEDTKTWSRARKETELTYHYSQWVHDTLIKYGVDVRKWQAEAGEPIGEVKIE